MPNNLRGQQVILTGTSVMQSAMELLTERGFTPMHTPLIQTVEHVKADDVYIHVLHMYDWLIFTSQHAVHFFAQKCMRHQIDLSKLPARIAAVGTKTAKALERIGLTVHFLPSVYSADVFITEFKRVANERVLFVRGSLAKATIREGTGAEEWTVYETMPSPQAMGQLRERLQQMKAATIVFASPSAVELFVENVLPTVTTKLKYAAIGHITSAALQKYGIMPTIQPETYTMEAVIEQLILEETQHD